MDDVLLSQETDEWSTPQALFDALDFIFNFILDVCASPDNAKCQYFGSKLCDGLLLDWTDHTCWMNPPYSTTSLWLAKAWLAADRNKTCTVALVASRTDTAAWHNYVIRQPHAFFRGRLKFGNSNNSAPFPSALVFYGMPKRIKKPDIVNKLLLHNYYLRFV